MNGMGKQFRKESNTKNRKKPLINQSQYSESGQKTTSQKVNFCSNTVFSLYFKNRAKKVSRRKTTRFFDPLPVTKITTPI